MALSGIPLTEIQKQLPSGALLPSGEANFFDISQMHIYNDGSGINVSFPDPPSDDPDTSIYRTYGPNDALLINDQSGIFNYNGLSGVFSNGVDSQQSGILNFAIFNPYIHYFPRETPDNIQETEQVRIPFVADFRVATPYRVYY